MCRPFVCGRLCCNVSYRFSAMLHIPGDVRDAVAFYARAFEQLYQRELRFKVLGEQLDESGQPDVSQMLTFIRDGCTWPEIGQQLGRNPDAARMKFWRWMNRFFPGATESPFSVTTHFGVAQAHVPASKPELNYIIDISPVSPTCGAVQTWIRRCAHAWDGDPVSCNYNDAQGLLGNEEPSPSEGVTWTYEVKVFDPQQGGLADFTANRASTDTQTGTRTQHSSRVFLTASPGAAHEVSASGVYTQFALPRGADVAPIASSIVERW